MTRIKTLKSILFQTLIITTTTFVLAEITFRIYHRINPTFIFGDRSYNRWRGKPYGQDFEFKLNSQGFKDVEFTVEKPENTFRILGVGDSFNFGIVPYRYNFLTLLEEKLNQNTKKNSQKGVEIINMGIPGLGPKDYLSLLVNEGLKLEPDMVLLSFYVGNDFLDNQLKAQERRWNRSYVMSFLHSILALSTQYEGQVFNPKNQLKYLDDQPTRTNDSYLNDTKNKSNMFVKDPADDIFAEYFKDAVSDILKIKDICDHQNIELVVLIIPDEVQVDQKLQAQILEMFDADKPDKLDFQLPNRLLHQTFNQAGIDYIDPLKDFKVASAQTRLYKPNDTHWNIAGNQLAAELLETNLSPKITSK
ncbi:MAG: hypothetical protein HC835_10615 [Oscillatoriales cyanobacterium RM2_1_1]|nr:hypothetical protein [Oscillatoriales cyanobacterium SM2_3_0]NJO46035.1 hypothetical protein [Oscillatoriales cyanobacterium RM2_1_1]